ncbi:glycoside hydrolase family 3 C-terminal domain-containing protein [Actinomadura napierensis]|uniref:glycoside hydrolase family 3 C-terminal domain-containing protein n=1 Tax=Actinomadura napierensis TaxID=267854 RepID=UPI0031E10815
MSTGLAAFAAGGLTAQAAASPGGVAALVSAMTLDEKLSFVQGRWDDPQQQTVGESGYVPGVPRLGIPPLRLTDGPAGVRAARPATAMPVPVALASSFDDGLAREYGRVLGRDARALGMDVVLAPMVNTIRVPYAGRNFEAYSEDPLVNSRTVAQAVKGIQSAGAIATTKHFAANNQETERGTINAEVGEQALQEIELPGFEAAAKAGTGAVMCSYNQLNGQHSCGNSTLLNSILRQQWGFGGWVMSDWGATHSPTDIVHGLDQDMPGAPRGDDFFGAPLKTAIQNGSIPVTALDGSVRRILGVMERFGLLRCASTKGPRAGCTPPARPALDTAADDRVAQKVAEDGAVLLRNTGGALPLTGAAARSIALVGTPATQPVIGGGGSSELAPTSLTVPRDEIVKRAGTGADVSYHPGLNTTGTVIPGSALSGGPIDFTGANALPVSSYDQTRTLTAPEDGDYLLTLRSTLSTTSLKVDGKEVTAGGSLRFDALKNATARVHLTKGTHSITVQATGYIPGRLELQLNWTTPTQARADLDTAVTAAKKAKTAVVFAYDEGTEGADRSTLALPYGQDAMISAVAKANPNTVVVLNTGSAVTMPWLKQVSGVLDMYYPGQMGGAATARLLFGDAAPGGRLTQTFPLDDAHTMVRGDPHRFPGVNGQETYSEGVYVGYRWYDQQKQKTLFPFGHGLSYTNFAYSGLKVRSDRHGLSAAFTITNTGKRAGDEVPQVYLGASPNVHGAQQAVRSLAGYGKVHLRPGQSRRVTIAVAPRRLQYWDATRHAWTTGTGTRDIWVGPSSQNLPLHGKTTVLH